MASQGAKKRDRELGPVLERRSSLLTSLVERARKAAAGTNVSFPDTFSSPASLLDDVLRDLGGRDSASASLFMVVMSDDERDELELTFSKDARLVEKLVRRKFDSFTNFVRLYCGEDLVPGEEILERILETVRERGAGSQPSSSVADEEEEVSGDEDATPEKALEKKKVPKSNPVMVPSNKNKKRRETRERAVENEVPKQPVGKKKKKQAAIEEEEEEKVSEHVQPERVLALMRAAEAEYARIVELAKNGLDLSASAVRMDAPDPTKLVARNIVKDVEALRECLCDVAPIISSIEGLGVLLSWWRVVGRACQMRALFTELRSRKGQKTLRMRYGELASKVPEAAVCFEQAWKYERLGGFLAEFPQFVFQRQLVTVADWFQNIEGEKGVLLDVLPSIVPLSSVFLKDRFELHHDGFVVYPNVMKDLVSDELVTLCKAHFDDDAGEDLFNNHRDVGSRHNDGLRLQRSIDAGELGASEMTINLKKAIIEMLKREHPLHRVKGDKSMVVLMSRENCKAQLAHTDFSKDTLAPVKNSDEKMPLACLVALMDDTAFDVWPGAIRFDESRKIKPLQVRLNAGDMLVFRGDLVHGGAAVGEQENVRIHAYIDVEGVIRPKENAIDETYFMHEKQHILPRPKKFKEAFFNRFRLPE